MTYFEDLDAWIDQTFSDADHEAKTYEEWYSRLKKAIKEKVRESYHNGKRSVGGGGAGDEEEKPREPKKGRFWPRRQK
jgi:hypothetical protein